MVNCQMTNCATVEGELTQVIPETIVMMSEPGLWRGIEAVQRRHTVSTHDFPALAYHTIGINLGQSLNAIEHIDGRRYSGYMSTGRINVLPAGLSSRWHWEEPGEADVFHLYLAPALIKKTATEIGKVDPDHIEIINHLAADDIQLEHTGLALLQELTTGCPCGSLFGESIGTALAVQLLQKYCTTAPIIPEFKGGLPKYKLNKIIEYINENLAADVALSKLASIVDMNVYHFAKMFKQSLGIAPYQYVIECRIERAKQLLSNSNLSITEICHAVGFDNQSHFTKLFRRYVAITPKKYRDLRP